MFLKLHAHVQVTFVAKIEHCFDPNMTQTCNSKMIKWPEAEKEVELWF